MPVGIEVQLSALVNPAFDYRSLSVAERGGAWRSAFSSLPTFWNSIAEEANASPEVLPLTDEQKAELDRRVAGYDADPSRGVSMDESLSRIRARFRRST